MSETKTLLTLSSFRKALLAWYRAGARDLPWRRSHDPYAIMVSELMLQQTQVKTVIPYFERFMARFPTPEALAIASEQDVLKHWQGLGYYRRARYLKEAAAQILNTFGGSFPTTRNEIDSLKGVGSYTGAAIASIAFGLPEACVDGNVIRVLSRLYGIDQDVGRSATKQRLQQFADELLDPKHPGDFNQAMMELGATVCTPRNPSCLTCPVRDQCQTLAQGIAPESRPFKAKRKQPSKIAFDSLLLLCGNQFLVAKRVSSGLMAGMWELPAQVADQAVPWSEVFELDDSPPMRPFAPLTHRFTHLHATYRISVFSPQEPPSLPSPPIGYDTWRWVTMATLASLPQTKVLNAFLPTLTSHLKERPCQASTSVLPGLANMQK